MKSPILIEMEPPGLCCADAREIQDVDDRIHILFILLPEWTNRGNTLRCKGKIRLRGTH
jgi:hypothetical protein